MQCQERSGFLFAHECSETASDQCARCTKSMCQLHTHNSSAELLCTTCAKGDAKKEVRDRRGTSRRRGDSRYRDDHDFVHYGSPFFYGTYHYSGWGMYRGGYWGHHHVHRHHDFTEADSGSLSGGAGEGFEDDLGGS